MMVHDLLMVNDNHSIWDFVCFIQPIFSVTYSYGLLKIMVVVKTNRAITVLRPSETNFSHRVLNKIGDFFIALCDTIIANITV